MSLADRLDDIVLKQRIQCCTCIWYDQLSDRDRAAFDELALREDLPRSHLLEMCQEEGLAVEESSFRRHMRHHHGSR